MEYVIRYSIKPKQSGAYRKWVLDNEARLKAAVPEGWTYLGTHFTVRGLGDHDCETRWALKNYGALDNISEAQDQLSREIFEFIHDSRPLVGTLLKSASEVRTLQ